jgi:hypothetical protein
MSPLHIAVAVAIILVALVASLGVWARIFRGFGRWMMARFPRTAKILMGRDEELPPWQR